MFRSAHEALQFAFRTLGIPILRISSINNMRGSSGNGDLTQHDLHAQAAIIMSIVEQAVDVNCLVYLKARYGHELRGGEQERVVADTLVRVAVAALPTGIHSRRGIERLIRMYFGHGISMFSARKDLLCNNRRYYEYRDAVYGALDRLAARAEADADMALEAAGLLTLSRV
ncbi:MAG: hypothetical protein A2143_00690 [Gallionellales bacterium RBG_16_57_15]|nr:MAG: hypothetical protein A2143_00690 [Gallionellales bacterium RBG_16_57_15]